ncbi:hypothetical protein PoHVEF18_007455 [Penicillium ochrochloron]
MEPDQQVSQGHFQNVRSYLDRRLAIQQAQQRQAHRQAEMHTFQDEVQSSPPEQLFTVEAQAYQAQQQAWAKKITNVPLKSSNSTPQGDTPFVATNIFQERLEAVQAMDSDARSDRQSLHPDSEKAFVKGVPRLDPTRSGTYLEVLSLNSVDSTDSASMAPPDPISDQLQTGNQDSFDYGLPVLSAPSSTGVDQGSPSAQR